MKTTEQIKQEIVNYLTKTSQHTFVKPKSTYKWSQTGPQYEYDYNEFTYFKVIKIEDEFFKLENGNGQNTPITYKLTKIDIDNYIKYSGNNSKCVLSNWLFLDKKMKSVKSNKYHLGEIENILESIK
jgi:DNA modification methylase